MSASQHGAVQRGDRELVATAGAVLHHLGLVDYLGHCSLRVPGTEQIVIKPKHSRQTRSPGQLGPDDMIVIDLDGKVLEGKDDEKPPAEAFIHTEIYKARPDVNAVVHTHQPMGTLLGVIGADLLPVLHVPSVICDKGHIETWDCPLLVTNPDLGEQLATALGGASLCHLVGHGIVAVADDLRKATVAAVALEQLATANLEILKTGRTPRVITPEELETLAQTLAPVDGRWAYYVQRLEEAA